MKNIKRLAAGIIAGAAISAAPLVAFAAPAFAATNAPDLGASNHSQVLVDSGSTAPVLVDSGSTAPVLVNSGSTAPQLGAPSNASHILEGQAPCGGNMNCDYCGCPGGN